MKLAKMSLAAAVLLGASAFAVENVKVSGDAKLYYFTSDKNKGDLFNKADSAADVSGSVTVTADLAKGVSAGVKANYVTTLGLENTLVSNTWTSAHDAKANTGTFPADVKDASWIGEAWVAATLGNTTAKLGRQSLDTPLLFTETWGVSENTFEAAVLVNTDLPDTTVVGAYVGKSNHNQSGALGVDAIVDVDGEFTTFGSDTANSLGLGGNGAYALGLVNSSIEGVTLQGWYYDIQRFAQAFWLQADASISGINVGAQYTSIDAGDAGVKDEITAFAAMAGMDLEGINLSAAYSQTGDKNAVAVDNQAGAESKMYTEMYWWFGNATAADTTAFKVKAEAEFSGIGLMAQYVSADQPVDTANELTIEASKSYGPLNTAVAFVNANDIASGSTDDTNALIVMLGMDF